MAKSPQYAGMPNPNATQKQAATLVAGDRIRVKKTDRGAVLPMYIKHFNAVATVIAIREDLTAVVPGALAIETDLGTVRTMPTGLLTIADEK